MERAAYILGRSCAHADERFADRADLVARLVELAAGRELLEPTLAVVARARAPSGPCVKIWARRPGLSAEELGYVLPPAEIVGYAFSAPDARASVLREQLSADFERLAVAGRRAA